MSTIPHPTFLGGGETGALMRTFDWSATPLGSPQKWPQTLKIGVRMILGSRYPMFIWWGPQLIKLYNDAYAHMTLGAKHPWALGRSAPDIFAEIWDDIVPRVEYVFKTGEATWDEELLLILERNGFPEESYHTFSYSPMPDDHGNIGGILCAVREDTQRVLSQRRLKTMRELALRTTHEARDVMSACNTAIKVLAANPHDLPFALIYLLDSAQQRAYLAGSMGLPEDHPARTESIDLTVANEDGWSFERVLYDPRLTFISNLNHRFGPLPKGLWGVPADTALVLPIAKSGSEEIAGFMVAGLSPRLAFDDEYRGFLELTAGHIATSIANAEAYEAERQRAEALAELDRAKTAFFSNVSHEFRTPLTLMLGPIEESLAEAQTPHEQARVQLLHRNALRLQKLVNTLLDFSRIESGRMRATYTATDLATFTTDLASVFRSAMEKAGLRFHVECDPLSAPVYVDRDMWEKIVLNLLSNAFKFTLAGGIEVRLREQAQTVQLSVRDTGSGIPTEHLPRLFERFHRIEGTPSRTLEGTGIGLALVKELVTLHHGTIEVESVWGQGTTFIITLPKGKAHLPPERVDEPRTMTDTGLGATHYVEEALRWLPETEGVSTYEDIVLEGTDSLQYGGYGVAESLRNSDILWADDNADMRDYVRRLLQFYGATVTAVSDGRAALEALRTQRPDLVLSDVMMPHLDGFGLLDAIRADPDLQSLPVILLSARAGEEAKVEGLNAGADDYLIKPFSARELIARVGAHLKLSQERAQAMRQEQMLRQQAESILESISDGFIVYDLEHRFRYVNAAAERQLGMSREALLGHSVYKLFPETRGTPLEHGLNKAMETGQTLEYEKFHEPSGRWYYNRIYPTPDGATVYVEDRTERKQALADLRVSEERYRNLFETMDEGFCTIEVIFDEQETPVEVRYLDTNPAFERHSGVTNAIGKTTKELGFALEPYWHETFGSVVRTGTPARFDNYVADLQRWFEIYSFRVGNAGSHVVGVLFKNITHRVLTERQLRESEERLRLATEAANIFAWEVDVATNVVTYSPNVSKVIGFDLHKPASDNRGYVHPDDRVRILEEYRRAIWGETDYATEYRFIVPDSGEVVWVYATGVLLPGPNGSSQRFVGITQNITARKAIEQTLQANERRQAFLVKLGDSLRLLTDPAAIRAEATRLLGEHLGANRVTYADVYPDGTVIVERGYNRDVPVIAGRHHLNDYSPALLAQYRAGETIVGSNLLEDPTLTAQQRAAYQAVQVQAHIAVPVVKEGMFAAALGVHQAIPREWTSDEVALVEEVAERTWATLARARVEEELRELNNTLEKRVAERTIQVEQLASALTLAEQEERQRVAQILHDDLQQRLYSLLVRLQIAGMDINALDPEGLVAAIQESMTQLTNAIKVTRSLVSELNPPVLEREGLVAALQWLADHMQEMYALNVHVVVKDECEPQSTAMRSLLVQMVRELLFNVVKHARTDEAWLILEKGDNGLCLHVEDHGTGFNMQRLADRKVTRGGYGLHSIMERLKLVGGVVDIQSTPGTGSRVTLGVPSQTIPNEDYPTEQSRS